MDAVLAAVQADIQPLGLTLHAGVWDCAERRWVLGEGPYEPDEFFRAGLMAVYPSGGLSVYIDPDGRPNLVSLVDVLQGWVIDELWRGWPERYAEAGEFICRLQPVAGLGGEVWWADHGTPVARVGELATVPGIR